MNPSYWAKAIASLLGNVLVVIDTYPNLSWKQIVAAIITTVIVWLVPNASPATNPERNELNALRAENERKVQ